MSEADIATAKRGFFAKFSKDFPAIFTSAVANSTVSIKGPMDLALEQIATSMSTAGKKFTDIVGTDFPGLLASAFANTDLGLEASVGDLMDKMNALAEEKSQALLKDTKDIITPIKDAIELNVVTLNESGLSEALKSMTDPAEIAAGAVAEFGNGLSNLISSGGELDLFVIALTNAGERINALLAKSQTAAEEGTTVAEQERIVAHENIIEKPRERFKSVDEVKKAVTKEIQEYRAGTDSSATVLRQLAQTLADQGKIDLTVDSDPTGIFEALGEGPSIRNKTPEELFNDIFGDSMGAPFAFADWNNYGEESGILDAANVGRGGQSTTDFMKIDQSKFDEGIASYGTAMTERLNKFTNAGLNSQFEREFGGDDAASKVRRQSAGLGDEAMSFNAGSPAERASMIEALQKLAVDRETKQNSVSSLYDELIGLGKRDEAKALLKALDEAGRLDVKMASGIDRSATSLANIESMMGDGETLTGDGETLTGAKGGFLRGPSHTMGGIMAELEGGEYVLSKNAVKRLGKGNLDDLNSGSLSMRTPQIAYGEDGGYYGTDGRWVDTSSGGRGTYSAYGGKTIKEPAKSPLGDHSVLPAYGVNSSGMVSPTYAGKAEGPGMSSQEMEALKGFIVSTSNETIRLQDEADPQGADFRKIRREVQNKAITSREGDIKKKELLAEREAKPQTFGDLGRRGPDPELDAYGNIAPLNPETPTRRGSDVRPSQVGLGGFFNEMAESFHIIEGPMQTAYQKTMATVDRVRGEYGSGTPEEKAALFNKADLRDETAGERMQTTIDGLSPGFEFLATLDPSTLTNASGATNAYGGDNDYTALNQAGLNTVMDDFGADIISFVGSGGISALKEIPGIF